MQIRSIHCLKKKFEVSGSLYKNFTNGRLHVCRHLTEIRRKGSRENECDAIIVLSNPKLVKCEEKNILYEVNPANIGKSPLYKIKDNSDLNQIMYLMERMQWDLVRIIYLTDLLYKNEARFVHDLFFMQKNEEDLHSIFSSKRTQQLISLVTERTTIIAAWGNKVELQALAKKAIQKLEKIGPIYGVMRSKDSYYYQTFIVNNAKNEQWLTKVEYQIKENLL